MAVPSRAFVGILVFALIATFAIGPYTILVLSGYHPPPETPYEALFPPERESATGTKVFLVLASLFCIALVVTAWKGLLQGARMDRQLRAERAARPPSAKGEGAKVDRRAEEQPPGYQ